MTKITIIAASVVLFLAAVLIFRIDGRPKKIMVDNISALDRDILTKRFKAARKRFSSKSKILADSVTQSSWQRYCMNLGGFTPEFQDAYALASSSGDTVFGAFKRKCVSDLQYHYFMDVILVRENKEWKILQLKLPRSAKRK